jgi:hypothetical protein
VICSSRIHELADNLPIIAHDVAVAERQRCCHASHQNKSAAAAQALERGERGIGVARSADYIESSLGSAAASVGQFGGIGADQPH